MQITVNDKPVDFQGVTVAQLVAQLGLPETGVAVAIGMDIVPKTEGGAKSLGENDKGMII